MTQFVSFIANLDSDQLSTSQLFDQTKTFSKRKIKIEEKKMDQANEQARYQSDHL